MENETEEQDETEEQEKDIYKKNVLPVHPLSNIEITNYFNYEPKFNGFFSRNNYLE